MFHRFAAYRPGRDSQTMLTTSQRWDDPDLQWSWSSQKVPICWVTVEIRAPPHRRRMWGSQPYLREMIVGQPNDKSERRAHGRLVVLSVTGHALVRPDARHHLFSVVNKSGSQKCCLFAQVYRNGSELQYGKATACACWCRPSSLCLLRRSLASFLERNPVKVESYQR